MSKRCLAFCFCLMIAFAGTAMAGDANCKTNENCDFDLYCAKKDGKCKSDGVCKTRPEICTMVYEPVCGCDGQTYSNKCVAASHGVNVAKDGECSDAEGATGAYCLSNENCDFNLFCDKPQGLCKGPGMCEVRPEVCPLVEDPVCGCDATTYSNSCFAHRAGVSIMHTGKCE